MIPRRGRFRFKEDLDKALDFLDEAGLDMDDGLRDLLESIDEEDIEAAMQAKANLGDIKITADIPKDGRLKTVITGASVP